MSLASQRARPGGTGEDHVYRQVDQLGGQRLETVVRSIGISALDDEVLAFRPAEFMQPRAERLSVKPPLPRLEGRSRARDQEADASPPPRGRRLGGGRYRQAPDDRGQERAPTECPHPVPSDRELPEVGGLRTAQAVRHALGHCTLPLSRRAVTRAVHGQRPRFGTDACGGDAGLLGPSGADFQKRSHLKQLGTELKYPFTLPGFGAFDKQKTGEKEFDCNGIGLAHVGLLPDMIADLR
jgi:hypothetical protein